MNETCFLDTNILVYLFDTSEPAKRQKAKGLFSDLRHKGLGYISTQVINEFVVIVSQKITHPIPFDRVKDKVVFLQNGLHISPLSLDTSLRAIDLKQRYKYSFWDALILASALENQCSLLYSEDMQHGQVIEGTLTIRNPFL